VETELPPTTGTKLVWISFADDERGEWTPEEIEAEEAAQIEVVTANAEAATRAPNARPSASGILHSWLPRVSVAKPTSAPVRF
jgi:hypothetical protein